jgi:D-alanine-D-alanine ligase
MNTNELIQSILTLYKNNNIDFDVYIIADTQIKTKQYFANNIKHADETEFFSRTEFAEISSAIFNCFGFAKVFYSEIEFIKYILDNNISTSEYIVYNFARDGRTNGKKSLIPAFCDLFNIRYTGSNAFVISLLRNKLIYTKFLNCNGIPVPISEIYTPSIDYQKLYNLFENQKVIVKNNSESASIGLTENNIFQFDKEAQDLLNILTDRMNSTNLLIQNYIDGIECEVLVLQYDKKYYALDPIEIVFRTNSKFIDTETSNSYNYDFKILDSPIKQEIQCIAQKAAELLGVKDYARFDFRIQDNIPYLIDIAGTPYTIYHSSIAYLFTQYYQLPYETIYKTIVTCMLSNYSL